WSAACVRELDQVAEIGPIDVVEAPIWDAQGIAVLRDGRYPLVVSLQTTMATWLESHAAQRGDAAWMAAFGERVLAAERELLEGAQAVKAISDAIRRDVESSYGVTLGERAFLTPLGIEERRAPLTEGHSARVTRTQGVINILFVGRLEERKGVDVLLRAFAAAHAQEPSLRLYLAGDDTVPWAKTGLAFRDLAEVRATLEELGEAVHVLGIVSEAQLGLAYEHADVFVAPSRYESFGLVFVEAMQRGLPVIGTAVGGVPEVVRDGVDGTLVPPDDPAGLTAAILGMVRDPAVREAMGRAGRARYDAEFTSDAMVARAERMYASVTVGTAAR
ncbi:MAG TPA: glycosyltransferase family 4 protein, partial [Candidatus Limnocylindrales bacterium]